MNKEGIITYIKNGKEQSVTINYWNKSKIFQQIFKNNSKKNKELEIKDDIEFIHFKNMYLQTDTITTENEETICIFENCTITNATKYREKLVLFYGSFEFINPKLINISEITSPYIENLIFTFDKPNIEKTKISLRIMVIGNIHLQGVFNIDQLELYANNLILGTNNKSTILSTNFISPNIIINAKKELVLNNCIIENNSLINKIEINSPIITIDEKSTLKSKTNIMINNTTYKKSTAKEYILLTTKELIIENLISILKGNSKMLDLMINNKLNKYLEKEFRDLEQEIKEKENNLKELYQRLDIEKNKKSKQIVKSLTKKPISYLKNN